MIRRVLFAVLVVAAASSAQAQGIEFRPASASSADIAAPSPSSATYAADIVSNGTFTGSATGWTLGGGGGAPDWAYSANAVSHASGGGTATLVPSTPLSITAGGIYSLKFTVSGYSSGTLSASLGGTNIATTFVQANGSYQFIVVAATTGNLIFTPSNTLAATLDTVSVEQITAPAAASLTLRDASGFDVEQRSSGTGGNYFAGQQAGRYATGQNNVGIGLYTLRNLGAGTQNTIVGSQSGGSVHGSSNNSCVGYSCGNWAGASNACVGQACLQNMQLSSYSVGLGALTGAASGPQKYDYCIAVGYSAKCTASNQAVIGSDAASAGITELYAGHGVTKASPGTFSLRGTGGSGSNNAAGDLEVAAGLSTGTGKVGQVIISTAAVGTSGSTAQTKIARQFIGAVLQPSNNSATTAASCACATDSACAVLVEYGVEVNDGASHHQQQETGSVVCNVINTNGAFSQGGTNGCTKFGNQQVISASGGTLAVTWTMTGANPALVQVNSNTGTITPASGYPKVTYTVKNLTSQACTAP